MFEDWKFLLKVNFELYINYKRGFFCGFLYRTPKKISLKYFFSCSWNHSQNFRLAIWTGSWGLWWILLQSTVNKFGQVGNMHVYCLLSEDIEILVAVDFACRRHGSVQISNRGQLYIMVENYSPFSGYNDRNLPMIV